MITMEGFSKIVLIVLLINLIAIIVNVNLVDSTVKNFKFKFEHILISLIGYLSSYLAMKLTYQFFKKKNTFINKVLRKGENWDSKILRQAENFGGCIYNIIEIALLYGNFYQTQYWPLEFGGKMILKNYTPLDEQTQTIAAQRFYVFYFGHYIHRLIHHLQSASGSSTYFQMLIHHSLTPALVFVSMIQNLHQWGFAIFSCFALSNFYLNLSRFLKDSTFPQFTTQSVLIVFIIDWISKRVYYYNLIVTKTVLGETKGWVEQRPDLFSIFFFYLFFLTMIGILNFYWALKLLKIAMDNVILKKKKINYEEGHVLNKKVK